MVINVISIEEEMKKVIFELNRESSSGPDIGQFYQSYWRIIGIDIVKVVVAFFYRKHSFQVYYLH